MGALFRRPRHVADERSRRRRGGIGASFGGFLKSDSADKGYTDIIKLTGNILVKNGVAETSDLEARSATSFSARSSATPSSGVRTGFATPARIAGGAAGCVCAMEQAAQGARLERLWVSFQRFSWGGRFGGGVACGLTVVGRLERSVQEREGCN